VVGLVGVWNDITQRRRSEAVQQAVYRIAEGANAAEGLDALLRAVHHIVGELMPAENFFVALYDRAAGLLTFPYFVDQVDTADAPRPLLPGLTEYVLRTGRPFLGTPEAVAALERRGDVELVGAPSVDWLGWRCRAIPRVSGTVRKSWRFSSSFRHRSRWRSRAPGPPNSCSRASISTASCSRAILPRCSCTTPRRCASWR
jgi:hypothetical protein